MPLIGYFLGVQFRNVITSVDHWIAFVLLSIIGGNMIREPVALRNVRPQAVLWMSGGCWLLLWPPALMLLPWA